MLSLEALQNESKQPTTGKPSWPQWLGQTVVCMATGPSLTAAQVDAVRAAAASPAGVRVIATTHLGLHSIEPNAAWCDVWYAADWCFWEHYKTEAIHSPALKISGDTQPVEHGIADLFLDTRSAAGKALQNVPGYAISGGHSGCQALQIAIASGASRIILVGYDCHPDGTRTNYFGRKPDAIHRDSSYSTWAPAYREIHVPNVVEVLNATPGSAITRFQRVDLDTALAV